MISEIGRAKKFAYNSFHTIDDNDLETAFISYRAGEYFIAAIPKENYMHLYWACDSATKLKQALQSFIRENNLASVYIEHVPAQFATILESAGFEEHSEYLDFWIEDQIPIHVSPVSMDISIRKYTSRDLRRICRINRECASQSRGFTTQTEASLHEWLSNPNSTIIVAEKQDEVIGYLLTSMYAFESPKGAVVWIRELAVAPKHQKQGGGRRLLVEAMNRGVALGAKRSFLACDRENDHAIRLYVSVGFKPREGQGQTNMIYHGNKGEA